MNIPIKKKIEIIKDPELLKYFLERYPDDFRENDFEIAEYALVKGYYKSFTLIFNKFYPDIKKIFSFGFKRDYTQLLKYDPYARMHQDYLICFIKDENILKKIRE